MLLFPSFWISKPNIAKPAIPGIGEPIKAEHVTWLINEIDGYKLSDGSKIGMIISNTGENFTTTINSHYPSSKNGIDNDVDVIISGDREIIIQLLSASDFKSEIKKVNDEKKVSLEVKKDVIGLAIKGYKSIYDSING